MDAIPWSLVPVLFRLRPERIHFPGRMSTRERDRKPAAFAYRFLNDRECFFQHSAAERNKIREHTRIELHGVFVYSAALSSRSSLRRVRRTHSASSPGVCWQKARDP